MPPQTAVDIAILTAREIRVGETRAPWVATLETEAEWVAVVDIFVGVLVRSASVGRGVLVPVVLSVLGVVLVPATRPLRLVGPSGRPGTVATGATPPAGRGESHWIGVHWVSSGTAGWIFWELVVAPDEDDVGLGVREGSNVVDVLSSACAGVKIAEVIAILLMAEKLAVIVSPRLASPRL